MVSSPRVAETHITVVGLGPGGPDLVTVGTLDAIERSSHRFLRTTRHPAASVVPGASSFDHVYESEPSLDGVYPRIVDELLAASHEHGEILYAVPGSPVVAERTVELLLAAAARPDAGVRVTVVPALSFLDLAWVRLGVDPLAAGVRIVDGQRFAVEAAGERGPLLVAQCDSVTVLSDVKLILDQGTTASLGADATVVVLQRLGLPDESIREVPWLDLDRVVEPDHLTSLYLPHLAAPVGQEVERFVELVATLRRECPWDGEQTHESLRRHLLEETYEVLEAIDALDVETGEGYEDLEEELGDLLFQIVFHTTLAIEAGQFTLADVAQTVHDKLHGRHPHVFAATGDAGSTADLVNDWEQHKKAEKGRDSVFDGIPAQLPALLYALKVRKKAVTLAGSGVDVPDLPGESQLGLPADAAVTDDTLGEALLLLVEQGRLAGIDPESALRRAAQSYRDRARDAERRAPSAINP